MLKEIINIFNKMNVQIEDYISILISLIILIIWYFTLLIFNYPLISVSILWVGMILLSIIYAYIYRKKNRNMKILKIRFFISAIPIYPVLFFYIYNLAIGENLPEQLRLIPIFVVFSMLLLNAIVVYIYNRKTII